jgi:hypothetical protein
MVAQADSNLRGQRLRLGVAGTSLLPGQAVYTMQGTLSLFLCNHIGGGAARAFKPLCHSSENALSAMTQDIQHAE